jgi:hypothetical protein
VKCEEVKGSPKCKKCLDDRKGCYWGGSTKLGRPKPRKVVDRAQEPKKEVAKREKVAEVKKEVARGRPGVRGKWQRDRHWVVANCQSQRCLSTSGRRRRSLLRRVRRLVLRKARAAWSMRRRSSKRSRSR